MGKNHLKRIAMPKTWTMQERKSVAWAPKVNPGAHKMEEGMPLVILFREILKLGDTAREIRTILNEKNVLVDGKRIRDNKYNIGLMDTLSIPEIKENFRITLNKNGKLVPVQIDDKEAKQKLCRINGKGLYKGKVQLRLSDGRVILMDKCDYKTSDSVVISVPEQKVISHISFEKGASALLVGGRKIGTIGTIEEIKKNTVKIKSYKEEFETDRKYCFVVGKAKPVLTIETNNGK